MTTIYLIRHSKPLKINNTFNIGVQWHPERMNDLAFKKLFESLVKFATDNLKKEKIVIHKQKVVDKIVNC